MVFTTDEAQHAAMKRPIAQAYSLSTLVDFEPFIDSTTAVFFSRLDELYADTDQVCDLGEWLQMYAFDVIGELTFSKRLGFLESGQDVEGIMANVAANFDWNSVIGQMPPLDWFLTKNPLYQKLFAKPIASPIITFGQKRMLERVNGDSKEEKTMSFKFQDPDLESKDLSRQQHSTSKPDFLSRFLTLRETQPDVVTEKQLLAYLFVRAFLATTPHPLLLSMPIPPPLAPSAPLTFLPYFIDEHKRRLRHRRHHAPRHLLLSPQTPFHHDKTPHRAHLGILQPHASNPDLVRNRP